MQHPFVALDTETTGLEPGKDEIIEVAAVRFQGAEILDTWHSLVKPASPLPDQVTRLTGITPVNLQTAPLFYTILPDLAHFLGDDPLVSQSVEIDVQFLDAQGLRLSNRQVDTYELSTLLLPELPERSLISVARALDIAYPEQHRAMADAQAVVGVFNAFWDRLVHLDIALLSEIVRLTGNSGWPLALLFDEVLQEAVHQGFGQEKPDKRSLAMRLVAPERLPDTLEETGNKRPLDARLLSDLLAPEGLFARTFPHYEHRPQQIEMLEAIVQAFNQGGQLIVEAGTGTGKSMAYLIPAVALAVRRGQPVVISTNTINLQDQLFHKDLPDLQHVLTQAGSGEPKLKALSGFRAAHLKGRNNYLCLRRWEALRRSASHGPDQVSTLVKTLLWLPRTRTGDRADLVLSGPESAVWSEMASNSDACRGESCPYQQSGRCFFFRARQRADAAHVVIVNHSLLLSNVATHNRVLPEHKFLIIDEAHNLEGVATDQLGFEITAQDIRSHLASISHMVTNEREEGILASLPALFKGEKNQAVLKVLDELRHEARTIVGTIRGASDEFFTTLADFVRQNQEGAGPSQYDSHWRITSAVRVQPDWSEIEIAWENVALELIRLHSRLERLHGLCEERLKESDESGQGVLMELELLVQRTSEIQKQTTAIVSQSRSNGIDWVSLDAQAGTVGLHFAPLHVGELLQEGLYQQKDAIILTSATLSTEGNTLFVRERLGLPEAEEVLLDSPFDYANAALLLVPEDMPDPREPQYGRSLARVLVETCRASAGRTLVLFTSHSALRQTYTAIRKPLEREEIAVLGQGLDGSRHVLLDKFRRNPRSVLLGTSSFWEGIDVVGEALSVLVITKLPFSVPSDPIFAARCELFEEPFYQYAVPQTVLRFKQGFGRLIRSQTDRGVVIMLDGRVVTRAYGPMFLHSLPPCSVRRVPLLAIPRLVQEWLGEPLE